MMKFIKKRRKGAALPTVVGLFILLSFIVISMLYLFTNNTKAIDVDAKSKALYYHCKSGIEIAEAALHANSDKIYNDVLSEKESFKPLVDSFDSKKISDLPEHINISITIEYSPPDTAHPENNYKYGDKIKIRSVAKNSITNSERTLTKYIDPNGINTNYE